MAQHLIGYQKRQYLENIIQDDVSEFKFYQGMIIEKGTQNVLNKLFDVLSVENEESLKFYEEWAVRVGQYGASSAFENIEFIIDESLIKNNPQGFELVKTPIDKADFIIRQTPSEIYLKPVNFQTDVWPAIDKNNTFLRIAGHVRPESVRSKLATIADILNEDITMYDDGDYVWCSFENQRWNVYRYSHMNIHVSDVTYDNNILTIVTMNPVDLVAGAYIGISNVVGFSGFYVVDSVDVNKIHIHKAGLTVTLPFVETGVILISKLSTALIPTINDIESVLPTRIKQNELVWTGISRDEPKESWIYNPVYMKNTIVPIHKTAGMQFGRSIVVNNAGTLLLSVQDTGEIWVLDRTNANMKWSFRQLMSVTTVNSNPDWSTLSMTLAVSADGQWLAVGYPNIGGLGFNTTNGMHVVKETGSGSAYQNQGMVSIYHKDNDNIFSLLYNIASPNPASSELFGSSLVFLDNKLLVGAPGHNMNAGIVYQYNYDTDWSYSSDTFVESLTTNYGKNLAVSNDRTVLTISASAEVFI